MSRLVAALLVAGAALSAVGVIATMRAGSQDLPDFSQWPAGEARKSRFFDYLRPLLEAENARVLAQRERLVGIAAALPEPPGFFDRRWLSALADDYDLDSDDLTTRELVDELLIRVDVVPVSLGLAQAAKESGWGTSRFAAHGNALFGQRCFDAGCGMVPSARRSGLRHEVRTFPSPGAAVASYVRNLNSHSDYADLRRLRAELRRRGQRVTGFLLARALASYSERRDDYIREVRQLIRFNDLGPVEAHD